MRTRAMTQACSLGVLAIGVTAFLLGQDAEPGRPAAPAVKAVLQPVEPDPYYFMEYMVEPPYKRLRAWMAAESRDPAAWKAIKSDALILAESATLLPGRDLADVDPAAWLEHASALRDAGRDLYLAAKKRDDATALPAWKVMIDRCNACHAQVNEGEPKIEP